MNSTLWDRFPRRSFRGLLIAGVALLFLTQCRSFAPDTRSPEPRRQTLGESASLAGPARSGLPGLVSRGSFASDSLGGITQPVPSIAEPDAVYGVGDYPQFTPELAPGEERELVRGYCSSCHSTTYINMQPPLPRETWQAEVNKMINTFGAQIPEEIAGRIVAYLQAHYTPETIR